MSLTHKRHTPTTPARSRNLVIRAWDDGYTPEEIEHHLKIPLENVRAIIAHAVLQS